MLAFLLQQAFCYATKSYYHITQNFGGVKLWRINCFMSFGEDNVGEFTIANISYFSEPGIWLGKILATGVRFAKFAKVFLAKILRYTIIVVFT